MVIGGLSEPRGSGVRVVLDPLLNLIAGLKPVESMRKGK